MRVTVDPPLSQWTLHPQRRVVATGHQAYLWHPGILAKYLAMHLAARRLGATMLHVVVDQDVYEPLKLELPRREGDLLTVATVWLGPTLPNVPPACQSAIPLSVMLNNLDAAEVHTTASLVTLRRAIQQASHQGTLAQQMASILETLLRPWIGEVPRLLASRLMENHADLLARMLDDASRCVQAYNTAVRLHPDADIGPLQVQRERVELPLWCLRESQPRQRVYADLSDTRPLLTLEDGKELLIGRDRLAPRALLLTAIMRSRVCGHFIHGLGGGKYDHAAEAWWRLWRNEDLAPMSVATADVHLSFDAPLATRQDLDHALWRTHHLRHNLDRELSLTGSEVQTKRALIAHMNDDRDPARRRAAFHDIHRINRHWSETYASTIEASWVALARARAGWSNRAVANKRDWCFALYDDAQVQALSDALGA